VTGAALGLALLLQAATPADRPRDSWFGADKLKHLLTSFFVQSLAYGAVRATGVRHGGSLAAASVTTATFGIAKEVHDRRAYGVFSYRDLTWDAGGGALATVMLNRTVR
jgi:uncharacterized protein YfiM (DUF2279 family)